MIKTMIGIGIGIIAMYTYALHNPHIQYVYPGDTFTLEEVDKLLEGRDNQITMLNNSLKQAPECPLRRIVECDCKPDYNQGRIDAWNDCGAAY
jgi:hypothetical protein